MRIHEKIAISAGTLMVAVLVYTLSIFIGIATDSLFESISGRIKLYVEQQLSMSVTYDEIESGILDGIVLRQITISTSREGATIAEIERLAISYDLADLLWNRNPDDPFVIDLHISSPQITLDSDVVRSIESYISEAASIPADTVFWQIGFVRRRIDRLSDPELHISITEASVTYETPDTPGIRLTDASAFFTGSLHTITSLEGSLSALDFIISALPIEQMDIPTSLLSTQIGISNLRYILVPISSGSPSEQVYSVTLASDEITTRSSDGLSARLLRTSLDTETTLRALNYVTFVANDIYLNSVSMNTPNLLSQGDFQATQVQADISRIDGTLSDYHISLTLPRLDLSAINQGQTAELSLTDIEADLDLIDGDIYDVTIQTTTISTETTLLLGSDSYVSELTFSDSTLESAKSDATEIHGSVKLFSPTLQVFKNPSRDTFHILTRADVLKAEAFSSDFSAYTDVDFVTLFIETDFTRIIDISMLASRANGAIASESSQLASLEGDFSTSNIDLYIQNSDSSTSIDIHSALTIGFQDKDISRVTTPFTLNVSIDKDLSSLGFTITMPDAKIDALKIPGDVIISGTYDQELGGQASIVYDNLDAVIRYFPEEGRGTGQVDISGITAHQLRSLGLASVIDSIEPYINNAHLDISASTEFSLSDVTWDTFPYSGKMDIAGLMVPQTNEPISGTLIVSGVGPEIEVERLVTQYGEFTIDGIGNVSIADRTGSGSVHLSQTTSPSLTLNLASIEIHLIDSMTIDILATSSTFAPGFTIDSRFILDDLDDSVIKQQGRILTPYGDYPFKQTIDLKSLTIDGSLVSEALTYRVDAYLGDDSQSINVAVKGAITTPEIDGFIDRFPFLATIGAFTIDSELQLKDLTDYSLTIHDLTVQDLSLGTTMSTIALQGRITEDLIDLPYIGISTGNDLLRGTLVGEYQVVDTPQLDIDVSIVGIGKESYSGYLRYQGGQLITDMTIEAGNISRMGIPGLLGTVGGIISFRKNTEAPADLSAIVTIREGRYEGRRYEGSLDIFASDSTLTISDSSLSFAGFDLDAFGLTYRFSEGIIEGSSDVSMDTRTGNIELSLQVSAQISPIDSVLDISRDFIQTTPLNTTIAVSEIITNDKVLMDGFNVTTILQDGSLLLFGGPQNGVELSITKGGKVHAIVKGERLPMSLTLTGSVSQGMLNLETQDVHLDLSFLNSLLDISEYLVFENGDVYGSFLITGPIDDPDMFGEIFCDTAELSSSVVSYPIHVQGVSATISEKSVLFAPFYGSIQNTYVEMTMISELESLIPYYFMTTLTIPSDSLVPVRLEIKELNLKLEGSMTGSVSFTGDGSSPLQIDGDVLLQDSIISINPNSFNTTRIPPERPIATDLHITTGKNVSVVLPSIELPIVSATISEYRTLDIVYESLRNTYSVNGILDILGGEIFYFQRSFFITEGRLIFNENQVSTFDPNIQLRARLRDFDRNGEKVDIYLIIENQPLKSYTPRFESKPSKTLSEIAGILGQNILPAGIVSNTDLSSAFALATIATDVFQQLGFITVDPISDFERLIRNTLNLDLFSIRTQLLQNILLDTFPLSIGQSVSINPIARYLDNTTVFLGKYVSEEFFLQAMFHLSTQSSNGFNLFWTNDLWLDLEFSVDWENPFFDVTLATQPRGVSPGEILDSLSIGVSWRYAF